MSCLPLLAQQGLLVGYPSYVCDRGDSGFAGHRECNAAVSLLQAEAAAAHGQRGGRQQLLPVALHGGMSSASQAAALQSTPRNNRKVGCVSGYSFVS